MKKIILLLSIIVACCINTFAQDTTKIQDPFITEAGLEKTDEIISKYADGIRDAFNEGMEHAVPVAKDGFELMVRYEIAIGITYLMPLLFFIVFFSMCIVYAKKSEWRKYEIDFEGVMCMILGTVSCIALIITMCTIGEAVLHLLAPEYYAIKDIIAMFK